MTKRLNVQNAVQNAYNKNLNLMFKTAFLSTCLVSIGAFSSGIFNAVSATQGREINCSKPYDQCDNQSEQGGWQSAWDPECYQPNPCPPKSRPPVDRCPPEWYPEQETSPVDWCQPDPSDYWCPPISYCPPKPCPPKPKPCPPVEWCPPVDRCPPVDWCPPKPCPPKPKPCPPVEWCPPVDRCPPVDWCPPKPCPPKPKPCPPVEWCPPVDRCPPANWCPPSRPYQPKPYQSKNEWISAANFECAPNWCYPEFDCPDRIDCEYFPTLPVAIGDCHFGDAGFVCTRSCDKAQICIDGDNIYALGVVPHGADKNIINKIDACDGKIKQILGAKCVDYNALTCDDSYIYAAGKTKANTGLISRFNKCNPCEVSHKDFCQIKGNIIAIASICDSLIVITDIYNNCPTVNNKGIARICKKTGAIHLGATLNFNKLNDILVWGDNIYVSYTQTNSHKPGLAKICASKLTVTYADINDVAPSDLVGPLATYCRELFYGGRFGAEPNPVGEIKKTAWNFAPLQLTDAYEHSVKPFQDCEAGCCLSFCDTLVPSIFVHTEKSDCNGPMVEDILTHRRYDGPVCNATQYLVANAEGVDLLAGLVVDPLANPPIPGLIDLTNQIAVAGSVKMKNADNYWVSLDGKQVNGVIPATTRLSDILTGMNVDNLKLCLKKFIKDEPIQGLTYLNGILYVTVGHGTISGTEKTDGIPNRIILPFTNPVPVCPPNPCYPNKYANNCVPRPHPVQSNTLVLPSIDNKANGHLLAFCVDECGQLGLKYAMYLDRVGPLFNNSQAIFVLGHGWGQYCEDQKECWIQKLIPIEKLATCFNPCLFEKRLALKADKADIKCYPNSENETLQKLADQIKDLQASIDIKADKSNLDLLKCLIDSIKDDVCSNKADVATIQKLIQVIQTAITNLSCDKADKGTVYTKKEIDKLLACLRLDPTVEKKIAYLLAAVGVTNKKDGPTHGKDWSGEDVNCKKGLFESIGGAYMNADRKISDLIRLNCLHTSYPELANLKK